jgi:hypothetical protein
VKQNGGKEKRLLCFVGGNLKKRNCLKELGEDGRIILKESSRNRVVDRGLD